MKDQGTQAEFLDVGTPTFDSQLPYDNIREGVQVVANHNDTRGELAGAMNEEEGE